MLQWQHLFSRTIMSRGKEYYHNNAVKDLRQWAGTYRASVAGREKYDVRITTTANRIRSMSCTCPYAEDGNRCKHMAAVLFAISAAELSGGVKVEAENEEKAKAQRRARKRCFPFRAPEAESEAYRYFRMEDITSSFVFYEDTVEEAENLLETGKMHHLHVDYGYTDSYMDDAMAGQATMSYGPQEVRGNIVSCLFRAGGIRHLQCNISGCRASGFSVIQNRNGEKEPCAHMTALLLALGKELEKTNYGDATDRQGQMMLNYFTRTLINSGPAGTERTESNRASGGRTVHLIPRLKENYHMLSAGFRIGTDDKLLLVKDLTELVDAVEERREMQLGKTLTLDFSRDSFDEKATEWMDFINRYVQDERSRQYGFSSRFGEGNPRQQIPMRASYLDEFFDLGVKSEVSMADGYSSKTTEVVLHETEPKLLLRLEGEKDAVGQFSGVSINGNLPEIYKGAKHQYVFQNGELCRLGGKGFKSIQPLFDASRGNEIRLTIGRKNLSGFYHNILPLLQETCSIEYSDEKAILAYVEPEAEITYYLDALSGTPICTPKAAYGEREEQLCDWLTDERRNALAYRDEIREKTALSAAQKYFPDVLNPAEGVLASDGEESNVYRILTEGVEELWRYGQVLSTPAFDAIKVRRKVSVKLGVSIESDIMDLSVSSEDLSLSELLEILESYKLKKKYHRLKNGEFIHLDETIAELSAMVSALHLAPKEFIRGRMHLPAYRALYLDKMLEQVTDLKTSRDSHFRSLVKNFKTVEDSDFEVPETLVGVLRAYQAYGYKWLRTLASCGFGGILADDMGLGKTLQMISVLLAERDEGTIGTSLIVCPASLVYNWVDEFARFAPDMKVCPVVGTQSERSAILDRYARWDVLITSYDLLKRDAPRYEDLSFLYEILDEAQYIKNHSTSASKSVKILRARHRFALTGTPIENRLSELWSIFDFLMPGFLYGYDVFRKELETPIVKKGDEEVSARLKRMVSPFVLRRVKGDVLKDLPEKVEETRVIRLEEEQQRLYDAQVIRMKEMIAAAGDEEFGKSRIRILAELTRIRQICCDPSLLFEAYRGVSAKREACLDLIRSAMEGEHRILVFSQFTSMLALLKEDLEREKIAFYELTGSTPKQERLSMVSAFNTGDVPVFLISLKAGGTGLNLTGADIVIHYEPWWNAAAQNQATDRTHRIGQTKIVTVFKLIAKDSIEEKIQKMQEAKSSLADEIISSDSTSLGTMNREELLALLE